MLFRSLAGKETPVDAALARALVEELLEASVIYLGLQCLNECARERGVHRSLLAG